MENLNSAEEEKASKESEEDQQKEEDHKTKEKLTEITVVIQEVDKAKIQSEESGNEIDENKSDDCAHVVSQNIEQSNEEIVKEVKVTNENDKPTNSIPKIKISNDNDNKIEIVDPDDYLLYLEVILKNIHSRFYAIYDETKDIPDLKIIVPKIRSEVLRGCNLVFSGLVPTNMKLQQSRAYFIAKSLGAEVSQNILENTTHLVAVTAGTFKVNAAKKNAKIKIVNTNWLWSCAERWEHVEELLFPLDRKMRSNKRQPPAHCHSPEHVINYSEKSEISSSSMAQQNAAESSKFIDTINPLLSFSNADLADMNKEFDQFFDSDTSSEDENVDIGKI